MYTPSYKSSEHTASPTLELLLPKYRPTWGVSVSEVKKSNVTRTGREGLKFGQCYICSSHSYNHDLTSGLSGPHQIINYNSRDYTGRLQSPQLHCYSWVKLDGIKWVCADHYCTEVPYFRSQIPMGIQVLWVCSEPIMINEIMVKTKNHVINN